MDRVIARCLMRDPAQRFAHVGELAQALAPFAPGSGPLVETILRLVASPSRSATGLPLAVLSESQRLALTPRGNAMISQAQREALTARAAPQALAATPPAMVDPALAAGGATGAWGSTASRSQPRSRLLLGLTFAAAMSLGLLLAWGLGLGRSTPRPAASAEPSATAAAPPPPPPPAPPPVVSASAEPSAAPSASAAPKASASARPSRRPVDPFGMDRK
jgi:serine/threonine-protein kinase